MTKVAVHAFSLALAFAAMACISGCERGTPVSGDEQLKKVELVNQSLREELGELEAEQPPSVEGLDTRIEELESEIGTIKSENATLRKEFSDYKREFPLR